MCHEWQFDANINSPRHMKTNFIIYKTNGLVAFEQHVKGDDNKISYTYILMQSSCINPRFF